MSDFKEALVYLLGNEKGLEENPNDPGGITNMGISLRFLRGIEPEKLKSYGIFDAPSAETIRGLSINVVSKIYENEFWNHASFGAIVDQNIANYVFDMAVNMGIAPAIKCLQRALWASYKNKHILPDDGILGNSTLYYVNKGTIPEVLLPALRSERAGDYRMIADKNPLEDVFLDGWLNRAYGT